MTDLKPCPVCGEPKPGRLRDYMDIENNLIELAYCRACPFFCPSDNWQALPRAEDFAHWANVDARLPKARVRVPTLFKQPHNGKLKLSFGECEQGRMGDLVRYWLDNLPAIPGEGE